MSGMIRPKGCRRCGGDLCLEQDRYGAYMSCIQCGAEYQIVSQDIPAGGKAGIKAEETVGAGMDGERLSAISSK